MTTNETTETNGIDGIDYGTLAAEDIDYRLSKLRRLTAELETTEQRFTAELERIEMLCDRATAGVRGQIDHHRKIIEAWHQHQVRENPRVKTITLPHGTVKARKVAATVAITDQDAAVEWCAQHAPEALKSSVLLSKLPATVTPTAAGVVDTSSGEQLPWATVKPERVSVTVTPEPGVPAPDPHYDDATETSLSYDELM